MIRRRSIPSLLVLACIVAASVGCGKKKLDSQPAQKNFTGTAAINTGKELHLIVDVQPSWIAGRQEYLPLGLAVLNRTYKDLVIYREGIVLETETGATLPLVAYTEFETAYTRQRMDLRVYTNQFLPSLNGRYPTPPFFARPLEFFPLRQSGIPPREEISLVNAELATGLIYFRIPDDDVLPGLGNCKLLMTPKGTDTQYVVSLQVYHKE